MEKFDDISIYQILLKDDTFGELVYDDEGKINGGKPFVIYTETVREFMNAVKKKTIDKDFILAKSQEGAKKGEAEKEVIFALIHSIVVSEEYSAGLVLSRLKDGTIQTLLKKL